MSEILVRKENHAKALAALYNASKPQGLGFLHYKEGDMQEEEAAELLKNYTWFDYLKGRVMKVSFRDETIDLSLYDRDNGSGSGEAALRAAGVVEETECAKETE